jgi:hypothetical protein
LQAESGLAPSRCTGGKRWRWSALRPFSEFMIYLLAYYFYRIAFVQHAFDHHRTVNTGHTFMSLRYLL